MQIIYIQLEGRKRRTFYKLPALSLYCVFLFYQMIFTICLRGLIPKDLGDRIGSLCNQIVFVAEDTDGSAIPELQRALEEYLSLIVGLTKKEYKYGRGGACT